MRFTQLRVGEKYYYRGELAEVVQLVPSNHDRGIFYPYALVELEDERIVEAIAYELDLPEVAQRRQRAKEEESKAMVREAKELEEAISASFPSFQVEWYIVEPLHISWSEGDCLQVLHLLGENTPNSKRLPSSYSPSQYMYQKCALLLGQRVRRALGDGSCSKSHFTFDSSPAPRIYMRVKREALWELVTKLPGGHGGEGALDQLFGA